MKAVYVPASIALAVYPAFGQRVVKDKGAIFRAMYGVAAKAFESKNPDALYKLTTPDFTETANGKKLDRAASEDGFNKFLQFFGKVHCTFEMSSYKVNGNTAVTVDRVHIWGTSAKPNPKTKKLSTIDGTRDETFSWVNKEGRWLIKSIVASHDKFTIDGKPVQG